LSKKIEHFKKCLNEEEEIRHNVKDTFYFWYWWIMFFIHFLWKS
jgi:hypothetical protein